MSKSTGNSSFRLWSGILFLFVFTAASIHSQGKPLAEKLVSLNVKNETLKSIFDKITEQTSLYFTGSADQLDRNFRTSITVTNEPLNSVLAKLLKGKGVSWLIGEKTITIVRGEKGGDEHKEYLTPAADIYPFDTTKTISLSGRVIDENGQAIIGATVLVRGTKEGSTTDQNGNFTINNLKSSGTLIIRGIGFLTQEIPYKNQLSIGAVKLKEYVGKLDEAVVIAYGITSKRISTSNIGTVRAEEVSKQPVSNPILALEGRVPGLQITQSSGLPGSGVIVRIQGKNSLAKGNDPLYIIDGIPYTSQLLPTLNKVLGESGGVIVNGVGSGGGNPLSFINPSDIESISILKDAAATAIYGSRAANGAILITTKKGEIGKTKVDINVQNGWGKVTRKLKLLSTEQYLGMRKEAFINDGVPLPTTASDDTYDLTLYDQHRYSDWQKTLIGNTAKYSDAQVSISGGSANSIFFVNAGYHKETTVFPGDLSNQKGALNFNLNSTSVNQKFGFQLSGGLLVDNNQLMSYDLTNTAIKLAPNAPNLYNRDGSLNWAPDNDGNSTWQNPLSYLENKYLNKTNNLIGNSLISYQILPGVDLKCNLGYTNLQVKETQLGSLLAIIPEERPFNERSITIANGQINTWIVEPQINYLHSFGKGKIESLIGITVQENNSNRQAITGSGFADDIQMNDIKSAPVITVGSNANSIYKYNAVFGRINYNWSDKYIGEFTARRDGSSRFGPKNRFHNFGAFSLAWIFSNENFIRDKLRFLSFGKFRGSYGTTGNDQIGDYQFLNLYTAVLGANPYQGSVGLSSDRIPNPYLQWEETRKAQFGLDAGILKDNILVSVNYYQNRSSNQLINYSLPVTTGFFSVVQNFPAVVQNNGWEISLSTTNVKKLKFSWTSSVNLTVPSNKLLRFSNLASSVYANSLVIGKPLSIQKAFAFRGVDPATGLYLVADKNGSPTSSADFSTDRTQLIDVEQKFYGGIQNSFSYKGFQLDILFQFVKQRAANNLFGNTPGLFFGVSDFGNQPVSVLKRWQKSGDRSNIQRFSANYTDELYNATDRANASDAAYSDASYIRLKNISLSWRIPRIFKTGNIYRDLSLFIHSQNLLTITNYKGIDPENRSTTSLPPLRVVTIGIRVSL